ncbi:MAG: hypothetical protein RL160_1128 [Bacteroidota bacterium]
MSQKRQDIEYKFHEAFKDFEIPVSDSDWNRIVSSLPENKSLEKDIQEAFQGYEIPVNQGDWARISAALPQKDKRRRAILWYSFAALSLVGAYLLWWFVPAINPPASQLPNHVADLNAGAKQNHPKNADALMGHQSASSAPSIPSRATAGIKQNHDATPKLQSSLYPGLNEFQGNGSNNDVWLTHIGLFGHHDSLNVESWMMDSKRLRLLNSLEHFAPIAAYLSSAGTYFPAKPLWLRKPMPAIWIRNGASLLSTSASIPQDADWQGKALNRTQVQKGLVHEFAVGMQIPIGSTAIQFGFGATEPLTPLKQHWRIKTRMVADSIPYRNMPGDTLFWIPVRFTDTLVDVVTQFSEKRLVIPFQISQCVPISPKFGILFQAGGQIGILQSMKATIPSPYTDYTWSQLQQGMAGTVKTNQPLRGVDAAQAIRTRLDLSAGTGFYYRVNKQLMLRTNLSLAKGLGPLTKQGSSYQQIGGQFMLMYQW